MTIEKRVNSYRIKKMVNGVMYSVTLDHKPTKREAEQVIDAKIQTTKKKKGQTFYDCAFDYIEVKRNVLSPSTIKGYRNILNNAFTKEFLDMDINIIDMVEIQKVINIHAATHSPKYTRNVNGFISAVFSLYRPDMSITTTLPQKIEKKIYIPVDDDIKELFRLIQGTEYEIPIKLCCLGLRRSEVCALTIDDLSKDNILTINKALVQDEYNKWVIKTTKTESSTRKILIPSSLADLIRETGKIYEGHPSTIYLNLKKIQKENNMKQFSLHKLRHYFASNAHAIGIPDVYIMESGGWKTDTVLKQVYRHALEDKVLDNQKKIVDSLSSLF